MKLDKIKFAKLVAFIVEAVRNGFDDDAIETLDRMIDIDVPVVPTQYVNFELVDELLRHMVLGNKVHAIKAYRALCDAGLKEAKDAVEKYWISKPQEPATLGDILRHAEVGG